MQTTPLDEFRFDDIPVILRRKKGRTVWTARITIAPAAGLPTANNDGNRLERSTGEADVDRAKARARQIFAEMNYRVERGESLHPKAFNSVVAEYLKWLDGRVSIGLCKPYLRSRIATSLERYYSPYFKEQKIDLITANDLIRHHEWREAYAASYVGDVELTYERQGKTVTRPFIPVAPSADTVRKERQHFNFLMKFAVSRGYVRPEGVPQHERLSKPGGIRSAFTADEMVTLQKSSAKQCRESKRVDQRRAYVLNHYKMMFLYLTGLRPVEVARIQFRDLVPGADKAGEASYLVRLRPQHLKRADIRKHLRTVTPLRGFRTVVDNLKKSYLHFDEHQVTDDDFVFRDEEGGAYSNSAKIFKDIIVGAGFNPGERYKSDYTLGSFRHTFITDRLYEKQDTGFVSRWVGTSYEMIDRHYSHVISEMEHQEARPPNTAAVLNHSLDFLLGKVDEDVQVPPPSIFDDAKSVDQATAAQSKWASDAAEFVRILNDAYGDWTDWTDMRLLAELRDHFGDELNKDDRLEMLSTIRGAYPGMIRIKSAPQTAN